jgi:hypothetical protein
VLTEIARVLSDDGVLVVSTPDRRLYSEVTGQRNPFHEHELTLEELQQLLTEHFPHVAAWGQRTITGSHLHAIDRPQRDTGAADQPDFYLERAGDEWRVAGDPAALYVVALASKAPLPEMADTSTLADCGIELVRAKELDTAHAVAERDAALRLKDDWAAALERERAAHEHERVADGRASREREAQLNEELEQRDQDIAVGRERIVGLGAEIASRDGELAARNAELADARNLNRRTEESVTWQAFQRARGRLYGAIGETSLFARALRLSLRLAGRILIKRPKPAIPPSGPVEGDGVGAGGAASS